jgi:hypothetical protein
LKNNHLLAWKAIIVGLESNYCWLEKQLLMAWKAIIVGTEKDMEKYSTQRNPRRWCY